MRPAAVAAFDPPAVEIDAFGVRHADASAERAEDVATKPRGRRFAVDAGDGDDRNAAGAPFAEHHVDDRFADGPRRARRRRQVHPQAGAGIDFDHHAALALPAAGNVANHHVDAADIEADGLGRIDGAGGDFRMNEIGDVGRRSA